MKILTLILTLVISATPSLAEEVGLVEFKLAYFTQVGVITKKQDAWHFSAGALFDLCNTRIHQAKPACKAIRRYAAKTSKAITVEQLVRRTQILFYFTDSAKQERVLVWEHPAPASLCNVTLYDDSAQAIDCDAVLASLWNPQMDSHMNEDAIWDAWIDQASQVQALFSQPEENAKTQLGFLITNPIPTPAELDPTQKFKTPQSTRLIDIR